MIEDISKEMANSLRKAQIEQFNRAQATRKDRFAARQLIRRSISLSLNDPKLIRPENTRHFLG